tara:strand:+ start:695 stop:943 length:249 start_codon:yes stop_codon:yes gene_type:complete
MGNSENNENEENVEYGVNEIIINYISNEQTTSIIEQKLLNGYSHDAIWIFISNDNFNENVVEDIWEHYRTKYDGINFLLNPI